MRFRHKASILAQFAPERKGIVEIMFVAERVSRAVEGRRLAARTQPTLTHLGVIRAALKQCQMRATWPTEPHQYHGRQEHGPQQEKAIAVGHDE